MKKTTGGENNAEKAFLGVIGPASEDLINKVLASQNTRSEFTKILATLEVNQGYVFKGSVPKLRTRAYLYGKNNGLKFTVGAGDEEQSVVAVRVQ